MATVNKRTYQPRSLAINGIDAVNAIGLRGKNSFVDSCHFLVLSL